MFKKLFKKKKKPEKKPLSDKIRPKIDKVSSWFDGIVKELLVMREKAKDLLTTNMKLGFKHLEDGNLTDATFRFRFVKFFWPKHYEAYYYLAYCLILNKKEAKARKILEELLEKDPDNAKAIQLLQKINHE